MTTGADTDANPDADANRLTGVLAFGDSITNGGGELQWGVALQSWAMWMARSLGIPYTGYAVDGARVSDVVSQQIPAHERRSADPGARYHLGCLYIGVNDVRAPDWNPVAFAPDFERVLAYLTARCVRVLALTAPLGLGIPPAGAKVAQLNAVVRAAAAAAGALVVDLSTFGARNHVMADRVHPTAFGQVAIAERALAVLARDGLTARVDPASLISFQTDRRGRLRGDLTYVYRSAKNWAGALWDARRRPRG
ncbi:MAG: GDSL-type esterase/lipase family protein [Solirubrobacteraceae bacterium]